MSPTLDPAALHAGLSRAGGRAQAAGGANSDSAFIDDVASESGLLAEQSQLADSTVLRLLEQSYGLKGTLVRIPTEKDETFRFRDGEETYLVKASSPDEDPAIVQLQTACMEHLEQTAPELPVQPGMEGVVAAVGFSGHGFKMASALGAVAAELVLNGTTATDVSFISSARFLGPGSQLTSLALC